MSFIRQAISCSMAFVFAVSSIAPAAAKTPGIYDGPCTHNQQAGSDSNVDVNVLVQNRTVPVIFSAYVPATVKIAVSRDKQIITPENLRIINGVDTLPIGVWDVKTKPVNGWTILDWNTNFQDKSMTDQKKFAMTLNGNDLKYYANGLPWEIQPAGELPLELDAKITYQSQPKDLEEIMTVSFTMDWMDRVDPPDGKPHATGDEIDKSIMKPLLSNLTGTIVFSKEKDPNREGAIPLNKNGSVVAYIDGQDAIIYSKQGGGVFAPENADRLFCVENAGSHNNWRFAGYKAKKLDVTGLDTSKTTNMRAMFAGTRALVIEGLHSLDTSNVTIMDCMFHTAQARELDLSGFNTENVTIFHHMFGMNEARILDLSSFVTAQATNMTMLFEYAKAEKVYCRTEEDRQRMIHTTTNDVPASHFIVKR